MPYDRQIPDSPIALSMLPRLEDLQDGDLIYVVRPTNPIGQRSKSMELGKLSERFTKKSSGWVSLENTSLVGLKALVTMVVPKGYGGKFEFRFDMAYSDSGTISPGYVQDLRIMALDVSTQGVNDYVFTDLQRVFHDADGAITGSNPVIATRWSGEIDIPDCSAATPPDSRTISFRLVLPYADTVTWALQNIKLKGVQWRENIDSNLISEV